jgi:hypothetical protein
MSEFLVAERRLSSFSDFSAKAFNSGFLPALGQQAREISIRLIRLASNY